MKIKIKKYLKLRFDIFQTQKDLLEAFNCILYHFFVIVCNYLKESHLPLTEFYSFLLIFIPHLLLALLIMSIGKVLFLWVLYYFLIFFFYIVYMLQFVKLCHLQEKNDMQTTRTPCKSNINSVGLIYRPDKISILPISPFHLYPQKSLTCIDVGGVEPPLQFVF